MFKRKYSKSSKSKRAPVKRRRTSTKKYAKSKSKLVKLIKRVSLGTQETKRSVSVNSARASLYNNGFYILNSDLLFTTQGATDPNTSFTSNRIGDEVTPVGVSFRTAVQLDPRQGFLQGRIMLIRGSALDVPSRTNLYVGAVENKQLDFINTERWTIMAQKNFTIRRPNPGVSSSTNYYTQTGVNDSGATGTNGAWPSGLIDGAIRNSAPIPYLLKMYFKGKMFGRKIRYTADNGTSVKNFSYHLVMTTYSNDDATDPQYIGPVLDYAGTPIGKLDQLCTTFYYKDA